MSKKFYICVATVGHCVILAQYLGEDPNTGQGIPSFFAAYMLKNFEPGCSIAEATDVQRVSGYRNTYEELIQFCHGFNAAAQMWRGVRPEDWKYRGTIDPKTIDMPSIHDPELKRLRTWPKEPE